MKTHLISKAVVVTFVMAFGSLLANAQNVKVDSQETQILLAASSAVTLQTELEKAGALGFHVVTGTTRGNGELVVLLERDVESNGKSQLRLVATNATGTFQKEIDELARQGYRAVPQSFLNKPTGVIGNEIVLIMERSPKPARRYEYKLIATNQTSVLESEWRAATRLGYRSAGSLTRAEVMLLMERDAK